MLLPLFFLVCCYGWYHCRIYLYVKRGPERKKKTRNIGHAMFVEKLGYIKNTDTYAEKKLGTVLMFAE